MDQIPVEYSPPKYAPSGLPDRRQRKPDAWARTLRILTLLVYPILILNLLIFISVASTDRQLMEAKKLGASNAVQNVSGWMSVNAFLPVMIVGLAVAIGGLLLNRKRARRRTDYNFQNQLILVILSAGGLVIYLLVRPLLSQ